MKSLFTTIVLAIFIGIAMFGIFGIHIGMKNHRGGCITATAQGTDCPKQSNLVDYLAFHIDAFKNFSTATFSDTAASLLILSLLVFVIAFGAWLEDMAPPQFSYHRLKIPCSFKPPQYELLCWLALHENSPSAA